MRNENGSSRSHPPGLALLAASQLERRRLLRWCLRWTDGNVTDAEDLLNEAWLRTFESPNDPSSIREPSAFLVTIIANLGRDQRRKPRTARFDPSRRGAREFVSNAPAPDDHASAREGLERVATRLEGVPPRQRSALLMRCAGDDYSSIARAVDTSAQNARKLVQFARAAVLAARDTEATAGRAPGSPASDSRCAVRGSSPVARRSALRQSPRLR